MKIFDKLKNHIKKRKPSPSEQKSFDFALMIIFFIGQGFVQPLIFRSKIVEHQIIYAITLFGILLSLSVWHKIHNQWKWPGISISNIFGLLFYLVMMTGILAHWASDHVSSSDVPWYQGDITTVLFNALNLIRLAMSDPFWANFYLTGIGFLVFPILASLNLLMFDEETFLACCRNPSPITKKDIESKIWKFLKFPLKILASSDRSENQLKTKKQPLLAKILSDLESPRKLEVKQTEEAVEVSFYITPGDEMKEGWPFFAFLGVGLIFTAVFAIPQFLSSLFEAGDSPIWLHHAFSTVWAVIFACGLYWFFIHLVFEKQVLIFGNKHFDIGKSVLRSHKIISRIPRKELPPLKIKSSWLYGDNEKLFVHYDRKDVEINATNQDKDRIKCLYEKYIDGYDISELYELCELKNQNENKSLRHTEDGTKLEKTDELTSKNIAEKTAFRLYDLAWALAIPFLRRNRRLAEGFGQRTLQDNVPEKADVWIQAASAGESYLAWSILKNLKPGHPLRVLVTSNTSQGFEILKRAISDVTFDESMTVEAAYFPFDKPAIMEAAVRSIQPKVMVLLELEIWPGLLSALKKHNSKILIINGRITPRSLRRYLVWPSLWRSLKPDKVLAISENDAERFATLFGKSQVEVMPNIKFDRIGGPATHAENPLQEMFPPDARLIVLGSTRREEEPLIEKIISDIHRRQPESVIALFPRHIHRVRHWESALTQLAIPWTLRSRTEGSVSPGTLILWDTFGELSLAYGLAKAVYVGGGLAPLGGQNFLEPLTCGIIPVIGPSWENFAWVGQEIVEQGLVRVATDWKEVAGILTQTVENPKSYKEVCEAALRYVKDRQGGTNQASHLINDFLKFKT